MFIGHKSIVYPSRSTRFELAGLGDIHVGHTGFARDYFEPMMKFLAEDDRFYILGMGDYFDEVTVKRGYYDVQQIDPEFAGYKDGRGSLKRVVEYVTEQFRPIAEDGRLLGLLEGNHDYVTTKDSGFSYVMSMAEELKVPYLGLMTLYRMSFRRAHTKDQKSLDIWATHGSFGGVTVGGKIAKLERMSKDFDADIYMMGHVHDVISYVRPQLLLNNQGKLIDRKQAFLITGSFMRTYAENQMGYGEPKMYSPVKLGFPKVKYWPHTGDIHVSE